jgi:16S rRNA (guanine(527)-N(7))-methyltransferase RsmG
MDSELVKMLRDGAAEYEITLDNEALDGFDLFTSELLEWNKVMNLTAITEPVDIIKKHYIDSLSLLANTEIPAGASMVDVGCGAGFPGIPVKLARPDIRLTSIDSLNKRILFLSSLVKKLGLKDCTCLHFRAEEAGRDMALRESFDVATARAVADLSTLAEYCLPLLKQGGVFYAMKGREAAKEANDAKRAIAVLGGRLEGIKEVELPGTDMLRSIIAVRKISKTHQNYPRQNAVIKKTPL